MNKTKTLFKLAVRMRNKYAVLQDLREIILNASGSGENGIMNFFPQLVRDQANLSINVSISPESFGGKNINVSPPTVDPPQFGSNYNNLSKQIKAYLVKYIDSFPQIPNGVTTLEYVGRRPEGYTNY